MASSKRANRVDWLQFFQERASRVDIPGYLVNGFVDPVLVRAIHKSVRSLIVRNRYEVVFDCGCGDGSVTAPLTRYGICVYGLDFSPAMRLRAERQGLIAIDCDLTKLPALDLLETCGHRSQVCPGCILFCESLGCIEMPSAYLTQVINANYECADFILAFPNGSSLVRRFVSLFDSSKINYFDLQSLISVAGCSSTRLRDVLAIISIPFITSFVFTVNQNTLLFSLCLRFLASNYVVRLVADFPLADLATDP